MGLTYRAKRMITVALAVALLVFAAPAVSAIAPSFLLSQSPPQSPLRQRFLPSDVATLVYQQMPELPLENQYINRSTRDVATSSTLVSRLISYHTAIKFRPPNYRLDWKLTMADFLGVNERIVAATYPSAGNFTTSPMEADIAAIRSLNRVQRDRLIGILVGIYAPPEATPQSTPPSNGTTP